MSSDEGQWRAKPIGRTVEMRIVRLSIMGLGTMSVPLDRSITGMDAALSMLPRKCFAGIAFCGLLLTGCAPSLSSGNEAGGTIDHVMGLDKDQALARADEHCAKFGKIARITGQDTLGSTMSFDCVKRDGQ